MLTDKAQHNRNKVFLWQSNACVLTLARVPLKLNDTPVTKNSFTKLLRAVLCFEEGDSARVELKQYIASRRMGCRKVVRLLPSQIVADWLHDAYHAFLILQHLPRTAHNEQPLVQCTCTSGPFWTRVKYLETSPVKVAYSREPKYSILRHVSRTIHTCHPGVDDNPLL